LQIHLVELPELPRMSAGERAAEEALVRWSRFLKAETDEELEEVAKGDAMLEEAKDILAQLSMTPDAKMLARQREMAKATYIIEMSEAVEEGEARGEARGRAEGKAEALLTILSVRGLEPPEVERRRIEQCRDLEQLAEWTRRAVTASSIDEVFRA
jgi:predicted transposase/invertase (TIGR01784 family)